MFSLGVKHKVASEVDVAHTVAEDTNGIRKGNAKILQDALEPDGLTRGNRCAAIFGFCARQRDCRLLLAAPGDRSNPKGEDEFGY